MKAQDIANLLMMSAEQYMQHKLTDDEHDDVNADLWRLARTIGVEDQVEEIIREETLATMRMLAPYAVN